MRFRKTLTLLMLAAGLLFALFAWAPQKPLTQDQVQSAVRSGVGDETEVKAFGQRGIEFAPAEDFLQSLKVAGGIKAFLKARRRGQATRGPAPSGFGGTMLNAYVNGNQTVSPVAVEIPKKSRRINDVRIQPWH